MAGGAHPSAGQSPQLNVYFHSDESRENHRQAEKGLYNLVLRRRTVAISVPAPEDSLSDRCAGSYRAQSHAAGTAPIAIEHIKTMHPSTLGFPHVSCCLSAVLLAPASHHHFYNPHSSTNSFTSAIHSCKLWGTHPGSLFMPY